MTSDSGLFQNAAELEAEGWELEGNTYVRDQSMLPLYEAKMVHHYDHRWATYEHDGTTRDMTPAEHDDPAALPLPRYWVDEREVTSRLAGKWKHDWLLGFRDITNTTNERTVIAAMIPATAVGNKLPLLLSEVPQKSILAALLSSFALDFLARQKLGGTTLNFFYVEQLAVPAPERFEADCPWDAGRSLQDWFEDAWSSWSTPPTTPLPWPLHSVTTGRRSGGIPTAEPSCEPSSTPPCFTSTASAVMTSTTSWEPSQSSPATTSTATARSGPGGWYWTRSTGSQTPRNEGSLSDRHSSLHPETAPGTAEATRHDRPNSTVLPARTMPHLAVAASTRRVIERLRRGWTKQPGYRTNAPRTPLAGAS
jgi:hypothetical protein